MKRVTFYIDGFNFYFGLKRAKKASPQWGRYYWIDIVALCRSFLGHEQILEKVVYFTASPLNPQKNSRQSAFLNANKILNGDKFEIVRGKYMEKHIVCPNCNYSISRPEEKKTDVNISVRMIADCVLDKTDTLILISADTDLIPPINFIMKHFKDKAVKVYFPPSNYSLEIKDYLLAHKGKPVLLQKNEKRFDNAIMDECVERDGKRYCIPDKWR